MDINPGGTIPPRDVIGRDALIQSYWRILANRSLTLVAPRRVGKSCILRKMEDSPNAGFQVLRTDVQGRRTVPDFVRDLFQLSYDRLGKRRKAEGHAAQYIKLLGGKIEAVGLKLELTEPSSLSLLAGIFDDLQAEAAQQNVTLVLCWDEFTYFLHDAVNDGHGRAVGQLLDQLRQVRQSGRHDRLRMVFTGSIGLEEVMHLLSQEKYTGNPFNDTDRQVVPLLEPEPAVQLARALVAPGAPQLAEVGAAMAVACEGHPYFIQHLARWMRDRETWSVGAVEAGLSALLDDSQDPLELSQYLERLDKYQGPEQGRRARALLDMLAVGPVELNTLVAQAGGDRDGVLALLGLLRTDLYVERQGTRWSFRLRLLQRYWRAERGIEVPA